MKAYDTVILGASAWACGYLLRGRGSTLVIERGSLPGSEFCASLAVSSAWESAALPSVIDALRAVAVEKRLLTPGGVEVFRLAPLFAAALIATPGGSILLQADLVGAERKDGSWVLSVANCGGLDSFEARRVIDCSARGHRGSAQDRGNILGWTWNAFLHGQGRTPTADAPLRTIPLTCPGEAMLELALAPDEGFRPSRGSWLERVEPLQAIHPGWKVALLARDLRAVVRQPEFELEAGWLRRISSSWDNPFAAAAAGFEEASR